MNKFKKFLKPKLLLIIIILLSLLFKYYLMKNYHFTFWFDQARDAYISRQILEEGDIKILGPSASGTNDTIYHGVLYYYLIGPVYTLFNGNPFFPALLLTFLASLALIPIYLITFDLFKNKTLALVVSLLLAFSAELIKLSNWLANPTMALLPIGITYWSVWQIFYRGRDKYWWLLGLSLALTHQSAIWLIFSFGPVVVGFVYRWLKNKHQLKLKKIIKSALIYLVGIGSIIVGQLMLLKNGVFKINDLTEASSHFKTSNLEVINDIIELYHQKIVDTYFPDLPLISMLIFAGCLCLLFKMNSKKRLFLLSWLTAPLWLLSWHPRTNPHILISVEIVLILFLGYGLTRLYQLIAKHSKTLGYLALTLFSAVFIFSQIKTSLKLRDKQNVSFSPQRGTCLKDQLNLIEHTYEIAQGEPYTFSSLNNPYGYSITWSYLYDWYGHQMYSYEPTFIGPDQTGLFGQNLININSDFSQIAKTHFYIIEPGTGTPTHFIEADLGRQNDLTKLIEEKEFGTLKLQVREKRAESLNETN